MKRSSAVKLVVLLLVIAALSTIALGGLNLGMVRIKPVGRAFERGLDFGGGTYTLYSAKANDENADLNLNTVRDTLYKRLSILGYPEALVALQGEKLRVEMPATADAKADLVAAVTQLKLNFTAADGTVVLENKHFASFKHTVNQTGYYAIGFSLNNEGKAAYEAAKTTYAGQTLSIKLDGADLATMAVDSGITNGQGQFIGFNTSLKARQTAALLNAGAMPATLSTSGSGALDAKLGISALHTAVLAASAALALAAILLIIVYRLPGLLAAISTILFALLTAYGLLMFPSVAINMYSIAGIVVSLAFVLGAHILVFNRMREEMGMGRQERAGVTSAYKHTSSAVLDNAVVLVLIALGLLIVGNASIKTFALTILIGTIAAAISVLGVTRGLLTWALDVNLGGAAFNLAKVGKADAASTLKRYKAPLGVAAVVLLAAVVVGAVMFGSSYALSNAGGSVTTVWVGKTFSTGEIDQAMASVGVDHADVTTAQSGAVAVVRTAALDDAAKQRVENELPGILAANYPDAKVQSIEAIAAVDNSAALTNAVLAIALASLLAAIYLSLRHGVVLGVATGLVALVNALLVLALFAVVQLPMADGLFAGMLAALGFALIAWTFVIARVRDAKKIFGGMKDKGGNSVAVLAASKTLPAITFTALLQVLMVGALLALGTHGLRFNALALSAAAALCVLDAALIAGAFTSIAGFAQDKKAA